MLVIDKGIIQIIIFVVKFDNWVLKGDPSFSAKAF